MMMMMMMMLMNASIIIINADCDRDEDGSSEMAVELHLSHYESILEHNRNALGTIGGFKTANFANFPRLQL